MRKVDANTLISVVAPIYNEVEIIEAFVREVTRALERLDFPGRYELVLVDDGSRDGSAAKLDHLAAGSSGHIKVVHLSRNFGHAPAVRAGLNHAGGDLVIVMDADLQDDPAAFGAFFEKWLTGHDVVYAVRTSRQERFGAPVLFRLFYRVLNRISEIKMPADAGNFSAMDRRVVDKLTSLPEQNRYLPGLRAWVGFRQVGVPVPRRARYDRSTRVGLRGLWRLANNAVFSFSHVPLTLFRTLGLVAIVISAALVGYACYHKFVTGLVINAWMSQFITVTFFGGINLLGVGILGEYVVRIYDEVKRRPAYIVDRVTVGEPSQAGLVTYPSATDRTVDRPSRWVPVFGRAPVVRRAGVGATPE